MALPYLRELRHKGIVEEIARGRFPYPSEDEPELKTFVNEPEPRISVGTHNGKELYPDIVVVKMPGQWLRFFAEVETPETITDEEAETQWKIYGDAGEFYLYVPQGMVPETRKLVKKHGVKVAGIRTWRFRPVWGLQVSEA